jgi:hypothetical protein
MPIRYGMPCSLYTRTRYRPELGDPFFYETGHKRQKLFSLTTRMTTIAPTALNRVPRSSSVRTIRVQHSSNAGSISAPGRCETGA